MDIAEQSAIVHSDEAKRPGRPKRADTMQTQRRRRSGGTNSKLDIPQSVKDAHPDMEFRWAADDGGRMQQLTINDDWDVVPNVDPIHGGKSEAGGAMKMHLLMKPRKFMTEDRAEKLKRLTEIEQSQLTRPGAKEAVEQGAEMYSVPGNKL